MLEATLLIDIFQPFHYVPTVFAIADGNESYTQALAASIALVFASIVLCSLFFGEIALRLGLPTVLGDLVAGLLLGVSALHFLILEPGIEINSTLVNLIETLTGANQQTIQEIFVGPMNFIFKRYAYIGVLALLFSIGLESNIKELVKVGKQAVIVALMGAILPFLGGFLGLTQLFHVDVLPALFAGAALTATSIGITAKVLQDLGFLQSQEGQIILGAAILDDILGIVILAVVVSILEKGNVDVGNVTYLIVVATLFVLSAVLLSKFFGHWYVSVLEKFKNPNSIFLGAIVFGELVSIIAASVGLEGILGAFAAGLIIGETSKEEEIQEFLKPFIAVFAMVFFVSIGASTDLTVLNPAIPANREGLVIASFLILVGIAGKVFAGFFAFSSEKINRLAIGAGLVPRGEVGLVFAGLGAATGALPDALNVAIVLMVIATTFIGPPLLRILFQSSSTTTATKPLSQ